MVEFLYHDSIDKDVTALERRFRTIRQGFIVFERLCAVHFNPAELRQVIAPAKFHRITQNEMGTLWKIELVMPSSGLRPSQWPRLWFFVKGSSDENMRH